MDYKIRVKNGGQIYRVPEDLIARVANAMLEGGTAEKIQDEPKKDLASRAKGLVENVMSFRPFSQNAARQFFPFTSGR